MTNDVVLSAALRANLLSLQKTQGLLDITQNRLATGKKVNSALDGPQAFFASQALTNRASDLGRLLDSIGQSIQVIKAADNGVTALTRLVEQADSIVTSARDAVAKAQSEAKIVGNRDLRGINDLTAVPGIVATDTFTLELTDDQGRPIQTGAYGGAVALTSTITINANDSIDELITQINNIHISDGAVPVPSATGEKAFEAKLNDKGQLEIRTLNGGNFRMNFITVGAPNPDTDARNLGLAAALGFGESVRLNADGTGANNVEFTTIADVALRSFPLYDPAGGFAQASASLATLENFLGAGLFANLDDTADDFQISINGTSAQTINLTDAGGNPVSIQSFVDQINANANLNTKIRASYDDTTGVLEIRPIDGTVQSIDVSVVGDAGNGARANFGFGLTDLTSGAGGERISESIRLASASATLAQLEKDFNTLREQITQLVSNGDTGYRGTNLLNGDELLTIFNEDRTSSLATKGQVFTADGLGLSEANFSRIDTVELAIVEVRGALEKVRNFGNTLANDLSVIQARENFTKELINTLKEGSDKLVNADQNEEGAKLLALQTRQQLGVTSLSLASQAQQSILRLFG